MSPQPIEFEGGRLVVPDRPIIAFLPGDGIGPEVWEATRPVLDGAVRAAYGGSRRVDWIELPLGERALASHGDLLPPSTMEGLRACRVAIKGPTTTPVGGGHRSLNVTLRQALDLYANVRPVRYFPGVVAPVLHPERLDVVLFRENTEDVYAGIEFASGSAGAREILDLLARRERPVAGDPAVGIKIISREGTRRLVRRAIRYALDHGRPTVTVVHKGNIMKATEGAFRTWAYELAREEFADVVVAASDLPRGARPPEGKVLLEDRIADAMFQDLLLRPQAFSVIAAPNLNGDYLSDAAAAQVGGLGLAPGANIGDGYAIFESTHGSAPDIAGLGIANPGSMMLSGAMLLEHLGWAEAADTVRRSLAAVLASGRVTRDLSAGRPGIQVLGTGAFSDAVLGALQVR